MVLNGQQRPADPCPVIMRDVLIVPIYDRQGDLMSTLWVQATYVCAGQRVIDEFDDHWRCVATPEGQRRFVKIACAI
jgi:hypothetical protein